MLEFCMKGCKKVVLPLPMLPSMLTTNGLFESVAIFLTSFVLSFLSRPIRAVYFYYDVSTFATEGAVAISGRKNIKKKAKKGKNSVIALLKVL